MRPDVLLSGVIHHLDVYKRQGMEIGQKVLREQAIASAEKCASSDKASAELKDAFAKFVETKDDTKANTPATAALVAELEKAAAAGCPDAKAAVDKKDYLAKKSVWIFGGDGWAYDCLLYTS